MAMASRLLEVDRLRVGFDIGGRSLEVIRGISFGVDHQQAVGLVGESGSGKTLTATAIIRLIAPPGRILGGSIRFNGRDLVDLPAPELARIRGAEISMVFQDPTTSLNPVFTIGTQLIDVIRAHQGVGRKAAAGIAAEILKSVGFSSPKSRLRSYPHELSGGMRQRVIIGMAVSCQPKLLILDEPTTALDVTVQAQVIKLIRQLKERLGFSILFITHNLDLAAEFCDRVIVMYAGEVVENAPVESVFAAARHPYTKALLECVPRLEADAGALSTIAGQPPAPGAPIAGCAFAARCAFAFARCRDERPQLTSVEREHQVACHAVADNLTASKRGVSA